MKITTSDGATFEAPSAALVVRALADASWLVHPEKRTWKEEVKDRVEASTGEKITTSNPGAFLASLERLGFLTIDQPLFNPETGDPN